MWTTQHVTGVVFDIQRWSLHDGPGIRTNVFLKGCPLRCAWCSNPESQAFAPQPAFFPDKCIGCRLCVADCPHGAICFEGDNRVDFAVCHRACGQAAEGAFGCTRRCYAGAMEQMGRRMTVEQVMDEVLRDSELYKSSGGGVTFTGGEPLAQPEFLQTLLRYTKQAGLQTALETCAEAPWSAFDQTLALLDFVMVDIKLLDEDAHKKWTGRSNARILENCRRLDAACHAMDTRLVVRTPVVPGVNDSETCINDIARFVREQMPHTDCMQLLPYHRLGRGKYKNIGLSYTLEDVPPPGGEKMERLESLVRNNGLQTRYE